MPKPIQPTSLALPKVTQPFFDALEQAAKQLSQVESLADGFYNSFAGDIFPEQNHLASVLENLVIQLTHETATEISFLTEHTKGLIYYINFRNKYALLKEDELQEIIDTTELHASFKLTLKKRLPQSGDELNALSYSSIRNEWTQLFKNQSFQTIKGKFK